MLKVGIYCEINELDNSLNEVSFELISKIFELKNKINSCEISAIAISSSLNENSINKAYQAGADKVILIKNETFDKFCPTIFQNAFLEFYKTTSYDVLIFPATLTSRALAPRITTALNTGLVADCTELDFILKNDEIKFSATRPTFGSKLMATILSKSLPQCATVRPKTFSAKYNNDKTGEFIEFSAQGWEEARFKILRTFFEENNNKIDFSKAKIVLCAGFGLNGKSGEYYKKLEKLAQKINATVGSTRKVVDFNLMPKEAQIGQTGSSTSAKLYIAFGVSGAIQHVSGIKNCKTIVAINNDENADIFKYADYKIIADAKKIIDEMLEKIKDSEK